VTTKNIKNQGFTLVELLIVIVIIAILTVVSLVAYNGLQNAKSAADAVAKKAELYNTAKSSYPTGLTILTNTADSGEPYYLDAKTVKEGTLAAGTAPAEANTIEYAPCTGNKGAKVKYYNFSKDTVEERTIGTGC